LQRRPNLFQSGCGISLADSGSPAEVGSDV
jgi:hypothetical protein